MALTGDLFRVTNVFQSGAENGLNIRYWRVTFQSGTANERDFFEDLSTAIGNIAKDFLTTDCKFNGLVWQKVRPTPVADRFSTSVGHQDGTLDDDMMPNQACGAITLYTGDAGRANRGRIYVPFPYKAAGDRFGLPTTAYRDLIAPYGNIHTGSRTVVAGGGAITMQSVLAHASDLSTRPIIEYQTRQYFTTQRRRGIASGLDVLISLPLP